jgi:hypothetical protein
MLYEAVTEAVLDYCARPCQFHVSLMRNGVWRYTSPC